ncbi:hypothetical protein AB0M46_23330 [Dactylosporangium sp. NPDC051485]|uniref:hypothetical protein n=1 Tax=Dactylosporangium sp. NPDC051485 TaxID=3154846 RepID=UPI00342EF35B
MSPRAQAKVAANHDCCTNTGLIYPDRGKRCDQHATAADRTLVADLAKKARPILGTQIWPYGADIDVAARQRLIAWAEEHNVKLAKTRCQGLHWLRTGRCGVSLCKRAGRWMDHVTSWTNHDGPALLLAQPYGLMPDDVIQLGGLATSGEFKVQIDGNGWYGYGSVAVELWRPGAYETSSQQRVSEVLDNS